jgi:hypothetical protein
MRVRETDTPIRFVTIEDANSMPLLWRTGHAGWSEITFFGREDLHSNTGQITGAVEEDRCPYSGQQKFIGAHLSNQYAARLIG